MDYQLLAKEIFKPTWKWTSTDVQIWLNFICMPKLKSKFFQHKIDGSCIQSLDNNDLENQMGLKSKISRRKIIKWIDIGFSQFNKYLASQGTHFDTLSKNDIQMDIEMDAPVLERASTSVLRERIKPENRYQNGEKSSMRNQMIITTYEGPHANFYTIGSQITTIGRSHKNQIVVLEESADKFHAQIQYINGKFGIRDLGTPSGTFVKVYEKLSLKEGMIVQMGSFQFTVLSIQLQKPQITLSCSNMVSLEKDTILINLNKKKIFSFGRKNTNDFTYDDQHLSGIHAKIFEINGQIIIEDMSSTNGTWIRIGPNGVQSQFYELSHGCVFKIGTTSTYICKFNTQTKSFTKKITKCQLCHINENNCVITPCNHHVICWDCANKTNRCPICNLGIEDRLKIFI